LVGPVLAEIPVAGVVEGPDRLHRLTLAHRHERHLLRTASDAPTGGGDAVEHRLEAHDNHPKAAIRAGVAVRRWLKPPPHAVQRSSMATSMPPRRRAAAARRSTERVPQVVVERSSGNT